MTVQPKIMVAVPTCEFARRADFYDYLTMLERPEGTVQIVSHGQSPARNRNIMIERALDIDCTHIMFFDDDMAFRPDVLTRLLTHDKDIVSGLYLMRNYPHLPVIFDESYEDGRCRFSFLNEGRNGLIEVVNTGLGACLIKTDVFRSMEKPWIRLGEAEKDHWCDDISFFNRARKAGYKLFCDLECPVGHMMTATIWPNRIESGKWFTSLDTFGTSAVQFPQQVPTAEELAIGLAAAGVK